MKLEIVERKLALLQDELRKVIQRVNLFEKVIIPEARENIRRIRIALGDRMTAAVARAKIAKEKLQGRERRDKLEWNTKYFREKMTAAGFDSVGGVETVRAVRRGRA